MKAVSLATLSLICIILVSGCTTNTGNQCTANSDCGEASCTDSMTALAIPTCLNAICITNNVDCGFNQLCLQDSRGVECQNKTDPGLPTLSCSTNAATMKATGTNPFNPATFVCQDDCPNDMFCDAASCACDNKKKISCYEYTQATTIPSSPFLWTTITSLFDPAKQMCTSDCPEGYTCNTATCTCKLAPQKCNLKEPKFYSNYFPDSPKPDVGSLFSLVTESTDATAYGPVIKIPALEVMEFTPTAYIPFPREQLKVHAPDDPMVVIGGYCANEYFVGAQALDIKGVMLNEPSDENAFCKWGGVISHEGVLEMCSEDLNEWLIAASDKGSLF